MLWNTNAMPDPVEEKPRQPRLLALQVHTYNSITHVTSVNEYHTSRMRVSNMGANLGLLSHLKCCSLSLTLRVLTPLFLS